MTEPMPVDSQPIDPRRGQRLMLLISACFVVPVLVAAVLVRVWQPTGHGAHGELLDPAQPIPAAAFRKVEGFSTVEELIDHHWTLLYWLNGDCGEGCEKSLYHMRQVRLALGKDASRVQTMLAMGTSPSEQLQNWLSEEHSDTLQTLAEPELPTFLSESFATEDPTGWIYLVDPLGNLLMRYAPDSDPGGMLDDLKHLLKQLRLSRVG